MLGLGIAAALASASNAQSILTKSREGAAEILKDLASDEDGVRSGSCRRPIGKIGTEEFSLYLLLPHTKIEGFIVEMSGSEGDPSEVVANGAIVSINDGGDVAVRGNAGEEWIAEAYKLAAEWILQQPTFEDDTYTAALARLPTERCPLPRWAQ